MARGNQKQAKLAVTDLPQPVTPNRVAPIPKVETPEEVQTDIEALRQSEGMKYWIGLLEKNPINGEGKAAAEVRDTYQAFLSNLRDYQMDHSTSEVRKTFKANLIKHFLDLPEPIRREISLPNNMVDNLYRGGRKTSNPVELGYQRSTTAASFTSVLQKASGFADGEGTDYDPKNRGRIYTGHDIESFDGIIDVNRAHRFKEAFNGMQEAKDRFAMIHTLGGNRYPREHEYIVYGIKWKEGVK